MSRAYFKEHVSVLAFNGYTGMMQDIGEGTLTGECDEVRNDALKDEWENGVCTKKKYTFKGELAANSDGPNWFTDLGSRGELAFSWGGGSVSGLFDCVSAQMMQEDALRWKVTLKSRGEVTSS